MPPPPPPPFLFAELPERVELVTVETVPLKMWRPPPKFPAVLPERVELVSVRVPWL